MDKDNLIVKITSNGAIHGLNQFIATLQIIGMIDFKTKKDLIKTLMEKIELYFRLVQKNEEGFLTQKEIDDAKAYYNLVKNMNMLKSYE